MELDSEQLDLDQRAMESVPRVDGGRCMHELFEEQARRSPDAVALQLAGQTLTYGELDRRAEHLARSLRRRGVCPGAVVGVTHRSSFDLVVSLFGILKAGGAYLYLDPELPPARLAAMREPGVALVLGPAGAAGHDEVDADHRTDRPHAAERVLPRAGPADLAYVIYTSGSTGTPKGVMVEHAAIVNQVLAHQHLHPLGPGDVLLQVGALSFDQSVLEFLWPLACGARLLLREPGPVGAAELARLVRECGVTAHVVMPSLLRLLIEEPDYVRAPRLRLVMPGSEPLTRSLADELHRLLPGVEVVNLYGPTEAAVVATAWRSQPGAAAISVGRPLPNTTALVLDRYLCPVPAGAAGAAGAAGELYLGGVQIARGYRARPDLTAERFVPDPYSPRPGGRLYRTGDRARLLADGQIELLGRTDGQVKIRGHRIELGEIEAVLAAHPGVRRVIALARDDHGLGRRLVAYVIPAPAAQPSAAELRDYLRQRLPEYMVPPAIVAIERLPLTASGKVDRAALPAPPAPSRPGAAPRSDLEAAVARVWAEVLRLPRVGIDDAFLDLGGNSLLAVRIASRLGALLGREVPLAAVLEGDTVSGMAAALERHAAGSALTIEQEQERIATRSDPGAPGADEDAIARIPRGGDLPLSPAQEGLWFAEQVRPGAYDERAAIRLSGPLELATLRHALRGLLERHEVLRSRFIAVDGVPSARVLALDEVGEVLEVTDAAGEAALTERIRREAGRTFDLERERPIRFAYIPLGPDRHVLLVSAHHLVCDGQSEEVLMTDLAELYVAARERRAPRLPTLPVQYADYAAWQRGQLSEERRERLVAHWRQALDGAPAVLELPTDRPRPDAPAHRVERRRTTISAPLAAELRALARSHGATLFMTMLGLFQALVARYAGQRDVVIGTPVVVRDREELARLMGLFVNTLPVRLRLDRATTVSEVVRRARQSVTDALAHRDLPFEDLVAELAPPRDPGRHPVFQVTCVLDNPPPTVQAGELELALTELAGGAAKFDLSLLVADRGDSVDATFEYACDLFSPAGIEQLARHYTALLAAACRRPDAPVAQLELMAERERGALCAAMAGRARDDGARPSVVRQIEAHMARAPDRLAVLADGDGDGDGGSRALSYGELDRLSRLLAGALRARGLGPDRLVAILSERSAMAVVAMVAALRAGGGYLPIDPRLPAERIARILRQAAPVAVLCPRAARGAVPLAGCAAIDLDDERDWQPLAGLPSDASDACEAPPDALAYVIFTSGSTGAPKGVMVTRRGLDAQLGWMQDEYRLSPDDRFLQLASLMFDFSVIEVFWPLMAGGALVLPRPGGELEPSYLAALGRETAATAVHFVPSMLAALLDDAGQGGQGAWAGITRLFLGGEALTADLARRCRDVFPAAELHNQYGPTEATINATSSRVAADAAVVPIGRAVADTALHVLDAEFQLAPRGGAGDLVIGGVQLARGYLASPAETAERFVPDPLAAGPGQRLYRTGDRARLNAAGELEYLGRTDHQVKLRGFRVELGEIEAALRAHPAVREAVCQVVSVAGASAGDAARIVAHVQWRADAADAADAGQLDTHLRDSLPDFMIPSAYVAVDSWPTTPTGKLDRSALPAAPRSDVPGAGAPLSPPPTPLSPIEQLVASIWGELLGLDIRSPEADFFALGGNSLLAMRATVRLNRATGSDLSVLSLLQARTVGRVARLVEEAEKRDARDGRGAGKSFELPPLGPRPDPSRHPPTFSQRMAWVLTHRARQSVFEMPRQIFEVRGRLDRSALRRAVEAVLDRHRVLGARFALEGSRLVQTVAGTPRYGWDEQDRPAGGGRSDGGAGAPAVARMIRRFEQPFDLAAGPMIRFAVSSASPERHWFGFAAHHIVFDGGSLEPFIADVGRAYRELDAGRRVSWGAAALALADVAEWEQAVWRTAGASMVEYWRALLTGARPPLLPMSDWRGDNDLCPRAAITSSFSLSGSVRDRLREAASALGSTPFVVAAASFGATCRALTGSEDQCVASPYMRRDLASADAVVGYMANSLLLRLDWPSAASFDEMVARTGERVFGAYRHGHIPLCDGADVMPGLPAPQAVASEQLYRVFFNYLDLSRTSLDLGSDAVAAPVELEPTSEIRFPLMVFVVATGDSLTWKVMAQARCYSPERLSALSERIATDLARRVGAPTTAPPPATRHVR